MDRQRRTQREARSIRAIAESIAAEFGHVLRTALIVLGWAVVAAAIAIVMVAVAVNLPQEAQSAVGIAIPLVFLGTLVVGPSWTIRRLRRRHQTSHGTPTSPQRLVGHAKPAATLPPEIFVELPLGWQSGLHPDASDEVKDAVRNDPGCLSLAHASTRVGQAYVPTLRIGTHGMPEPGDDFAEWLDGQETVFRDAMADPNEEARFQSIERVRIPAGEAIRVEFSSGPEPGAPLEIAEVQYYVPTRVGFFALWFMCEASDLAGYRATFDEMAQTFLRTDLHFADYLDEFVLKATT